FSSTTPSSTRRRGEPSKYPPVRTLPLQHLKSAIPVSESHPKIFRTFSSAFIAQIKRDPETSVETVSGFPTHNASLTLTTHRYKRKALRIRGLLSASRCRCSLEIETQRELDSSRCAGSCGASV